MFGSKKDNHKATPLAAKPVDVGKIDTLISTACQITGDIHSENSLKIDGQITGDITATGTVVISEQGRVLGDINANVLVIYGQHSGNSSTQSIHIQNSGYAEGNIDTTSLQVEPSATYRGEVTMSAANSEEVQNQKSIEVFAAKQDTDLSETATNSADRLARPEDNMMQAR